MSERRPPSCISAKWLLQALREHGSPSKLAAELKVSPTAISRALCEFEIFELRYYKFKGDQQEVVRKWLRQGGLTPAY